MKKDRRVGPPADGSKSPRNRRGERLLDSAIRVLLIIAIGLALMWAMGIIP
jgi:hypothetical protein